MAASTSLKPIKLGEFLKEKQEPFVLEIYLAERRHQKNNSSSCKSLPSTGGSNKIKRKVTPHCPKVLRVVYNKLTAINSSLRIRKPDNGKGKFGVHTTTQVAESDNLSTASSSTVVNSCSESDEEATPTSMQDDHASYAAETSQPKKPHSGKQAVIGNKLLWECDTTQLSPVSVLAEAPFHGASPHQRILIEKPAPYHKVDFSTREQDNSSKAKITEETILSASIWKFLVQSEQQKPSCTEVTRLQDLVQSSSSSQLLKSKVLQQTRQLLFDCVREIIKTHVYKVQGHCKQYLGSEGIGKFICDKIKLWGKLSADETTLQQLLDFEFHDSAQEWSNFEQQSRDIGLEIADAIFEESKNEIVVEIEGFLAQNTL